MIAKAFKISAFFQRTIQPWRRHFQVVSRWDNIFHIQQGADLSTGGSTIIKGDPPCPVKKETQHPALWLAPILNMYQFKTQFLEQWQHQSFNFSYQVHHAPF